VDTESIWNYKRKSPKGQNLMIKSHQPLLQIQWYFALLQSILKIYWGSGAVWSHHSTGVVVVIPAAATTTTTTIIIIPKLYTCISAYVQWLHAQLSNPKFYNYNRLYHQKHYYSTYLSSAATSFSQWNIWFSILHLKSSACPKILHTLVFLISA